MKEKVFYPVLVALLIAAIGTSSKSIVDTAVNSAEDRNIKQMLHEAREERKEMRRDIKDILKKI